MTPDQINALIQQLLQTGEILATKAFDLALRQVYLKMILNAVFGLIPLMLLIAFGKKSIGIVKDAWTESRYHDEVETVLCHTFLIFATLWFLVELVYVISYLVNPEWYAVQLLISTFMGQ